MRRSFPAHVWIIVYRIPTTHTDQVVHREWFRCLKIDGADVFGFHTRREAQAVLTRLQTEPELSTFNDIHGRRAHVRKISLGTVLS